MKLSWALVWVHQSSRAIKPFELFSTHEGSGRCSTCQPTVVKADYKCYKHRMQIKENFIFFSHERMYTGSVPWMHVYRIYWDLFTSGGIHSCYEHPKIHYWYINGFVLIFTCRLCDFFSHLEKYSLVVGCFHYAHVHHLSLSEDLKWCKIEDQGWYLPPAKSKI